MLPERRARAQFSSELLENHLPAPMQIQKDKKGVVTFYVAGDGLIYASAVCVAGKFHICCHSHPGEDRRRAARLIGTPTPRLSAPGARVEAPPLVLMVITTYFSFQREFQRKKSRSRFPDLLCLSFSARFPLLALRRRISFTELHLFRAVHKHAPTKTQPKEQWQWPLRVLYIKHLPPLASPRRARPATMRRR